jgi:hypothetical protein
MARRLAVDLHSTGELRFSGDPETRLHSLDVKEIALALSCKYGKATACPRCPDPPDGAAKVLGTIERHGMANGTHRWKCTGGESMHTFSDTPFLKAVYDTVEALKVTFIEDLRDTEGRTNVEFKPVVDVMIIPRHIRPSQTTKQAPAPYADESSRGRAKKARRGSSKARAASQAPLTDFFCTPAEIPDTPVQVAVTAEAMDADAMNTAQGRKRAHDADADFAASELQSMTQTQLIAVIIGLQKAVSSLSNKIYCLNNDIAGIRKKMDQRGDCPSPPAPVAKPNAASPPATRTQVSRTVAAQEPATHAPIPTLEEAVLRNISWAQRVAKHVPPGKKQTLLNAAKVFAPRSRATVPPRNRAEEAHEMRQVYLGPFKARSRYGELRSAFRAFGFTLDAILNLSWADVSTLEVTVKSSYAAAFIERAGQRLDDITVMDRYDPTEAKALRQAASVKQAYVLRMARAHRRSETRPAVKGFLEALVAEQGLSSLWEDTLEQLDKEERDAAAKAATQQTATGGGAGAHETQSQPAEQTPESTGGNAHTSSAEHTTTRQTDAASANADTRMRGSGDAEHASEPSATPAGTGGAAAAATTATRAAAAAAGATADAGATGSGGAAEGPEAATDMLLQSAMDIDSNGENNADDEL